MKRNKFLFMMHEDRSIGYTMYAVQDRTRDDKYTLVAFRRSPTSDFFIHGVWIVSNKDAEAKNLAYCGDDDDGYLRGPIYRKRTSPLFMEACYWEDTFTPLWPAQFQLEKKFAAIALEADYINKIEAFMGSLLVGKLGEDKYQIRVEKARLKKEELKKLTKLEKAAEDKLQA